MALTEQTIIDQISADEYGNVSVRARTDILRDGEVVSSTFHRHVVGAGDPLDDEDERVQAIAKVARKGAKA
jgi:hypothetical protein